MKTSILQSMLARNKEIISGLHFNQLHLKREIKELNKQALSTSMFDHERVHGQEKLKVAFFINIQKNSKSLKQLAEIQKAIKEEIRANDAMEAYVVWLTKRGD
jgi:hypothetical protein